LRDRLVAEAAQQASAGRHHLRTFY
jgi:hypothetical protein